jgi:putative ABC transport system ATP-binding protein
MTLICEELTVEYGSGGYIVRPIDALDVEVRSGHLALLLGASGCGKTTLLSVFAAILRPTRGSVRLDGLEVTNLRGAELTAYRRRSVGIVFQAFNLIASLTASENVQVPLRAAGLSGRRARARADELLERVSLADRRGHRPSELSGGQQQRVAIARALALDPPMLLADEPTAHLDYIQIESVLQLLRQIADEGRVVVVATHDERMVALSDRIVGLSPRPADRGGPTEVQLAPGRVLFNQGDPSDLIFVVEEGEIELVRVRDDGGEELLARLAPGQYFGELGPMFGIRRSATARAVTASRLLGLPPTEFRHRFRGETVADLMARSGST